MFHHSAHPHPFRLGGIFAAVFLTASPAMAAPVMSSASLTPQPVDTTNGGKFLTITVAAADPGGVQEISAAFRAPSGFPLQTVRLNSSNRISGTDRSGEWSIIITVPGHSPPETQTISWQVRNVAGQTTVYEASAGPLPAGVQGSLILQNSGLVDTVSPLLTAITTDVPSVNITTEARTVQLNTTMQDSGSGLASASVFLYPPTGSQYLLFESLYFALPPFSTSPVNLNATLTIPRYLASGSYRWVVTGTDGADRISEYGGPAGRPFPGGFSGTLQVVNSGPVDSNPPSLISLNVSPGTRPLTSLPSNITFTVQASDDVGVETAEGLLASPDGTFYNTFFLTRSSGTALNGSWTGSTPVSAEYPAGTHLIGVQLTDVTGKSSIFGIYDYFAPLPAGSAQSILITNGTPNAYTTWRYARPALTGTSGVPGADYDRDGLPNAVEFLCGTDPLAGPAADPNASRAPTYSLTATHLRVEYRLSAANAALGSGNNLTLQPQSSPDLGSPWLNITPSIVSGDLRRAEIPLTGGTRRFLRFTVLP